MKIDFVSNPKKILFPKDKITKKEFVEYYKKIAKKMIPLIKDRPISLKRFPDGIEGKKFFQKKTLDYYPKWIKTILVKREKKAPIKMPLINDLDSLLYIANQVGEIHIWLSKKNKQNKPDRLVFDLDPPSNDFQKVVQAAKDFKKLLDDLNLPSFFMTTGSKGLHIIIPIKPQNDFDTVRDFAKKIALILTQKYPEKYTAETRKEKRKDRVFIDYLRNGFAQTTIAPYSVRAIEKAPIATPIEFNELSKIFNSQNFNVKNIFKKQSKNPFSTLNSNAVSIKSAINKVN
ncbi:MAG: non-homologous end-joining DNA ligase, partial [Parachlamydiales bacterium]|nr:non-homologous end-joining DNA ligase [Parachlamydiales bacterium]